MEDNYDYLYDEAIVSIEDAIESMKYAGVDNEDIIAELRYRIEKLEEKL
jgi:prefoldin subunit 5